MRDNELSAEKAQEENYNFFGSYPPHSFDVYLALEFGLTVAVVDGAICDLSYGIDLVTKEQINRPFETKELLGWCPYLTKDEVLDALNKLVSLGICEVNKEVISC